MIKALHSVSFFALLIGIISFSSCAHKYYVSPSFEQQTRGHRTIAVLPAEMVFTGNLPKNASKEDIAAIEEKESTLFQQSLYKGILQYANTKKHEITVDVQDISTTQRLMEDHNISIRDSWKADDRELAKILGVDAVVRMRIQKKRYMSDLASMGVGVAQQIISAIGTNNNVGTPFIPNKTNDIFASCNVVSNSKTLWNDNYEGSADWNTPSDAIIDNITEKFGKHFPYKRKRNS